MNEPLSLRFNNAILEAGKVPIFQEFGRDWSMVFCLVWCAFLWVFLVELEGRLNLWQIGNN